MGPVDQLDMEYISSFGEVTQLKKEEVLGYTEDEILKALNKL